MVICKGLKYLTPGHLSSVSSFLNNSIRSSDPKIATKLFVANLFSTIHHTSHTYHCAPPSSTHQYKGKTSLCTMNDHSLTRFFVLNPFLEAAAADTQQFWRKFDENTSYTKRVFSTLSINICLIKRSSSLNKTVNVIDMGILYINTIEAARDSCYSSIDALLIPPLFWYYVGG